MDNDAKPPERSGSANFGALAYGASIYFIAVATVYLWAYWSQFSINILEYLAVTDVLKHAAFPIASTVGSVALGVVLGNIFGAESLPPGVGKGTTIGRFLNKHKKPIFFLAVILVLGLYSLRLPLYAPVAPFAAAILFTIPIANLPLMQRLLPDRVRNAVILFLCALPLLAHSAGVSKAGGIVDGTRFHFLADPALEPRASLRYVGHAGDEYFFYDPSTKAIVLMKRPTDKPLMFSPFKL